jgi:hypothetical protein
MEMGRVSGNREVSRRAKLQGGWWKKRVVVANNVDWG